MSRSHYTQAKEVPISVDVLTRNVMKARKYQYRVHRKPPNGHGKHDKKVKVWFIYPPAAGWPGGKPDQNMGFKMPQKALG